MLQTEQLTYRIGKRMLVNSVSMRARAGEMLAIVGANGAGKSTLLRLCAGELTPTSGQVAWAGQPIGVYSGSELARLRGFLHQQNSLAFSFRVDELVLMGRYPHYGTQPGEADYAIAEEALRMVDMSAFADRIVTTLSGGEQQRVQLARVLAQLWNVNEGLLLLDEPTTGLDLLHQHQLLGIARQMAQRGYTVVAVLHDLNMAAQYADRLLMLRSGRVEAVGPPTDVLTPALIERVFNIPVQLINNPITHSPMVVVGRV